jgi:hypothetical protein
MTHCSDKIHGIIRNNAALLGLKILPGVVKIINPNTMLCVSQCLINISSYFLNFNL